MKELKRINMSKFKNFLPIDKYYTNNNVALDCISKLDIKSYDFIVEPSAGNGSFYNQINHPNKIGMDIMPEHGDILEADWFDYNIDNNYKKVLIIGNPPFGVNNYLSVKFLKHAFSFNNVETVAFILPNVYNKHTKQKMIPLEYRIKDIYRLPSNSFTLGGNIKNIPCSFYIFDKSDGEDLRFIPEKYNDTKDFAFGNDKDFDIFVFGESPNKITFTPSKNNRGYYLKSKIPVKLLIKRIRSVKWVGNSSASGGVFCFTKAEFCYEYTNFFDRKDK